MDYNRNIRYFTKANIGKLATASWLAAIVGVVVAFLRMGWLTYMLGGTVAFAGIVCGIVCTSKSISDKEYDGIVNNMIRHFRKHFNEYVHEKVNQHNGRGKAPISIDEEKLRFSNVYFYEGETLSRLGQDDRRRSNKLLLSAYFLDKQNFYIGYELVGVTEDLHEELFGVYSYADVESIVNDQPEPRSPYAEYDRVTLKLKRKATPIVFYIINDAEMDTLLSTVRSRITSDEE